MTGNCANTKERIFEEAVRLFSENGYPIVPLKDVAKAVHTSETTIYRHYKNKADLLNQIIKAFESKLQGYLPTKKQIDRYIETDTPAQLLQRCMGRLKDDEVMMMHRLHRITYMEQLTNAAARDLIFGKLHGETAKIIKYTLDKLIEKKSIPDFDTQFVSVLWAQSLFSDTVRWISDSSADASVRAYDMLFERMMEMVTTGKIPT